MPAVRDIDETYFDHKSKAMYYVLGLLFPGSPQGDKDGFLCRSTHKELVDIVKNELQSEHTITKYPGKNSYQLKVSNVPDLRTTLDALGLDMPIYAREFPNYIDPKYMSHFVRGFLDNQSIMKTTPDGRTMMQIVFNETFLTSLYEALVQYAEVQRNPSTNDRINFGHSDSIRIFNFIYKDWTFIQKTGLYLPQKFAMFNLDYEPKIPVNTTQIRANERMSQAMGLLREHTPEEVMVILGYQDKPNFWRAFKQSTGLTVHQYLDHIKKD